MNHELIIINITSVVFFVLAFIAFVNPLRVNNIANKWFGVFLFSVGCMLLNGIIEIANAQQEYRQLMAFNELSRLAMAPALYLSVLHYTLPNKNFKKIEYLHFIPFFLFCIYSVPFIFFPDFKMWNSVNIPYPITNILRIVMALSIKIQMLSYWVWSYYQLNKHQKNIQQITANTVPVNLSWLKFLLLGIIFMLLLWFNLLFFKLHFLVIYTPLGYLAGSLLICYFMLAQKEIYPFEEPELEAIDLLINVPERPEVTKRRLADEQLAKLKTSLTNLMEEQKIYLDNELDLPNLANEMGISIHDLSYLLNEGFGMNFFRFINTYRVEEAKQLMVSDKYRHLNILGIAYSSGFNSKSTFNTAFKKETGIAPSQFIQQFKSGLPVTSSV